jgi:tetratricopeptide (TPR) repeat protein
MAFSIMTLWVSGRAFKEIMRRAYKYFTHALTTASMTASPAIVKFRDIVVDHLAECLEHSRRFETLLKQTEAFIPIPYLGSASSGAVWPQVFLRKAHAYEALGQLQKAVEAYEEFLALWKNADTDLPALQDAKSRLAKLFLITKF